MKSKLTTARACVALTMTVFAIVLATPLACSSAPSSGPCVSGSTFGCVCINGRQGAQSCNSLGTFDACVCDGVTPVAEAGPPLEDGGRSSDGAALEKAHAPVFLSLGTNLNTITQDQSVTFTAILTDPDGIDDLIGGALTSADGSTQYGSFVTSAQEGAYSLSLSWSQLNQAVPITFSKPQPRVFAARFFDVAGHRVERTVTLTLTCGGQLACAGQCRSTSCYLSSATRQACDGACAQSGMTCNPSTTCERRVLYGYGAGGEDRIKQLPTCATTPAATEFGSSFAAIDCCCLPP